MVADVGEITCQVTRKLKRATAIEFTTITAIIFIQYCAFVISYT